MTKSPKSNYFHDYLARTDARVLIKMEHYLDIYARILADLAGRSDISFLEIGVYKGGSIGLWKGYFGQGAKLVFADIDPACARFAAEGVAVEIGDQADPAFLAELARKHGPFDLIIDDGGHFMAQQKASMRGLWPALKDGGRYIIEDTHTSYWPGFGGGYLAKGSMIEAAKTLVDQMHSWYTEDDATFPLHPAARQLGSVQFYDSMIVIEKDLKAPPVMLTAQNGQVARSRKILEVRGRRSVFAPEGGPRKE